MIPSKFRTAFVLPLALGAAMALSACVYRLDVQQGNEITPEMIAEVKPGMTRREVVTELVRFSCAPDITRKLDPVSIRIAIVPLV